MQGTTRLCDGCGLPAVYRFEYRPPDGSEDLCEECALERGAEANGAAEAALIMIGRAIQIMRSEDVSDDTIRAAMLALLESAADLDDSLDDLYEAAASVLGGGKGRWRRRYTLIGAVA